jgi:hypothetical protein
VTLRRLSLIAFLAVACSAAPQGAGQRNAAPVATSGTAHPYGAVRSEDTPSLVARVSKPVPTSSTGTANRLSGSVAVRGTWAYAEPSFGSGYLAIPEGPGWIVLVCGPLDCFEAVSTDAGPELWLQKRPHNRIGDLSAAMFQRACGSLSAGLCSGSYEILGAADQHPDDPPADPRDDAMRDEVGDELYTLPPTDQGGPG